MKEIYTEGGRGFKGLKSFYRGLDSALGRQLVYCTGRIGIYFSLGDYLKNEVNGGKHMTSFQKTYVSLIAGGIASMIGTPTDLILVRMQIDPTLPPTLQRKYKNFGDAFKKIRKNEGLLSCWKGCYPTVIRASILNFGMLATYDECKERL